MLLYENINLSLFLQYIKHEKMDYIELNVAVTPLSETATDVLAGMLADIGYESFVPNQSGMSAYIDETLFDEVRLKEIISDFFLPVDISYSISKIKSEDWNEEWEKNYFQPIVVGKECVIHSTFHKNVPKCEYDITIDPKMAFGTGHHETTGLMLQYILDADLYGKCVLDMGCGTAVLAILASMRGASQLTAVDIDSWAYDNALENLALNKISNVDVRVGGAEILGDCLYDVIFANINRNILLEDMPVYASVLKQNGVLYMSGFYKEDIPVIEAKAVSLGLEYVSYKMRNNWVAVRFSKK